MKNCWVDIGKENTTILSFNLIIDDSFNLKLIL